MEEIMPEEKKNNKNYLIIDPGFVNLGWMLVKVYDNGEMDIINSGVNEIVTEADGGNIGKFVEGVENWFSTWIWESIEKEEQQFEVIIEKSPFKSSWISYKLGIMETALYCRLKLSCSNISLLPANEYKRHFKLCTGNHYLNKKLVDLMAKEHYMKLWNRADHPDSISCYSTEEAGNSRHAWDIGKGAKANHKSDCFMMLLYKLEKRFGSLDTLKIIEHKWE